MKLKIGLALVAFSALSVGCGTTQSSLPPNQQQELSAPLHCEESSECKLMWERATFFVTKYSRFKMQIHNESVIQTYNPTGGSTNLGFNITREPLGNGKYRIWVNAACDNMFGCAPDRFETIIKAKRYIRTGQE